MMKTLITRIAIIGALLSDVAIWRLDRYFLLSDQHASIALPGQGNGQLITCVLLWIILYCSITSGVPVRNGRIISALLLAWTGWISFLGGIILGDDLSYPIILLCSCLAGWLLAQASRKPDYWGVITLLFVLILVVLSGYTDFFWRGYFYDLGRPVRWRGPWINANVFGTICALGLFWIISLILKNRKIFKLCARRKVCRKRKLMIITGALATVCCSLGIFGSQSRSAVWGVAILMIFFTCFSHFSHQHRKAGWAAMGIAIVGMLLVAVVRVGPAGKTVHRISSAPSTHDLSLLHRWRCWKAAGYLGLDKPMTGWGWNFLDILKERQISINVTDVRAAMLNNFTQTFAARGAWGLLGLCGAVLVPLVSSFERLRKIGIIRLPQFLSICFIIMQSIFNDVIYSLPLGMIFWMLFFNETKRWKVARPGG